MNDFVSDDSFNSDDNFETKDEHLDSVPSEPFEEIFDSLDNDFDDVDDSDYYDLPLINNFKDFLEENITDINAPINVDYWHIANILVLFVGDYDSGVNELMETVLENNHIECEIHLPDSKKSSSLRFVFKIFEEDNSKQIHVTTSKTNNVNNVLDLNQLHDVTNIWNSLHFFPTASIKESADKEYTVRTKQILNITNGVSITQLHSWIDDCIPAAFNAQKEIASSYIDL